MIGLKRYGFFILIASLCCCFSACDSNKVFEESKEIADYTWEETDPLLFEIQIDDTTTLYNLYITLSHTFFYPYSNLWIKVNTTFPNGDELSKRVELPLAEKGGKWHGDCLGDICDIKVPIQRNAFFENIGIYKFEFQQNMRINPLPQIIEVGFRVEKTGKSKESMQE